MFSQRERRELAGRARTLPERLDHWEDDPSGDSRPEDAVASGSARVDPDQILDAYRESFPDEEAFHTHLVKADLTPETVRRAIADTRWPADETLPPWVDRLGTIVRRVTEAEETTVELDGAPFRAVYERILAAARDSLPETIPRSTLDPALDWLAERVHDLSCRVLYVSFKSDILDADEVLARADPEEVAGEPTEYYREFVASFEDGRLQELCLRYPVFARQLATVVESWVTTVAELWDRIESDPLAATFDVAGPVRAVTPLADDTHTGGRTPFEVTFETGSIVYKPRPVEGAAVLYDTIEALSPALPVSEWETPTLLRRPNYGWVETLSGGDTENPGLYYRRAGVLACVAYILGLTDCQYENVIADGDRPTVVDGETICQPYVAPDDRFGADGLAETTGESALATGLLPYHVRTSDAGMFGPGVVAGLGRGTDEKTITDITVPQITAVNTDLMSVVGRHPTVSTDQNTPTADGTAFTPGEYLADLCTGFDEAYRAITRCRDAGGFLGSVVDIDTLSDIQVRYVFRNTWEYTRLLHTTTSIKTLRDGVAFTAALGELSASIHTDLDRPDRWGDVFTAEREALVRRDVPRFTIPTDGTTLYHDGTALDAHLDETGLNRLRQRVAALDVADRRRQVALLRETFDPERGGAPETLSRPPSGTDPSPETVERVALESFQKVADAKLDTDGTWVSPASRVPLELVPADRSLYYGQTGVLLAAAAVWQHTGRRRARKLADEILVSVQSGEPASESSLGAARGVGSVVYGLTVAADIFDDEAFENAAQREVAALSPDRIAADQTYDVMDGTAGLLLGLLAHFERTGDGAARELGISCGDHLLENRTAHDGHRVWLTREGWDPITGFAHGQAGIAYALARLSSVTDDLTYARAADDTFQWIGIQSNDRQNGVGHTTVPEQIPDWCRGKPGRVLAELGARDVLGDGDKRTSVGRAVTEVRYFPNEPRECCPNATEQSLSV